MGTNLPKKVPFRQEHTGDAKDIRMQRLAQQLQVAHEQTKAYVAAQAAALANFMQATTLAMNDQDQKLSATQVSRGAIRVTGATTTQRILSGFPRPVAADGSDQYWRFFWNNTTGGFNVLLSDGINTLAVGSGGQFAILFTSAGPVVLR